MTGWTERRVLLDTSVIIDPPSAGTGSFAVGGVSAVTVGELYYSIDAVEQMSRRRRLRLVLDTYDMLPFDAEVAESRPAGQRRASGRPGPSPAQDGRADRRRRRAARVLAGTRNAADLRQLERVLTVVDVV